MKFKSPVSSRYAAMLMVLAAVIHSLVAFDLVLHFIPDTPEAQALWAVGPLVKCLWIAFVILGAATAILLYRAPLAGFLSSLLASACLYLASVGLWQGVKGGFWIVMAANVLAAFGAWQAIRPKTTRGSA
ncbi:hypothetical protein LYSHEL_27160 [Lysobacter helvus]|uniref:DoxX-like protein n=2 Tax=Lysobacteraceae TaxID=32033 RepID=A0ABM7Q8G6_9GAMM|nr:MULTISPECIES: hypothetical protein [Lysobacter]BCT93689.1 hypothetical protein LYSCAS_27130 [Lysobacter caseinilyticus]BCT96845.1 hypothetical protein LYSHEL_27160 [Lysobacter helvus]